MAVTILPFVQQVMTRYIMSTYFAMGLIGNLCNFMVFFKQTNHNPTPCSIYLLALSIFAIVYLLWSVTPLLYTLDHIDPQIQSLAYCKIRLYGSHIIGQFVRFSVVFACADRYFITRTSARIRAWSSLKMARRLLIIMCSVWIVAGLHLPVFMDIRGGICWMFDFYKFFYPIYQFILVGIIPPVLMSVFGFLTVRSLHQRHAANTHVRQKDHDLMRMLIAEIMINIFTSIPFSANLLYGTATFYVVNKSAVRVEIEAFVNFVSQFLIHLLSVAPFYLFLLSSKSFRREFSQIWVTWWYKYILRRARVSPLTGQSTVITAQHKDTLNKQVREVVVEKDKRSNSQQD
jgi:hypothetical protein